MKTVSEKKKSVSKLKINILNEKKLVFILVRFEELLTRNVYSNYMFSDWATGSQAFQVTENCPHAILSFFVFFPFNLLLEAMVQNNIFQRCF